jgi:hypothetical protein
MKSIQMLVEASFGIARHRNLALPNLVFLWPQHWVKNFWRRCLAFVGAV